jgi:thiol:disulfide interchange protein
MHRSNAILLALALVALVGCSKQGQPPGEAETSPGSGTAGQGAQTPHAKTSTIPWLHDLAKAEALAKEQDRDLFIDISAEWCAPCTELVNVTFADPAMAATLTNAYVPLNLDVSEQTDEDLQLMSKFGVKVLPALVVVRDQEILLTIRDFIGPTELAAKLAEIAPRASE